MKDRINFYRNRDFAIRIAEQTGGEFINKVYNDEFGQYWVVIWRNYYA